MNILLDFLTLKWPTGAGEYARRVYYALLQKIKEESLADIHLFALFDSREGIAYEDMQEGTPITTGITHLDAAVTPIAQLVMENKIDVLFIACAQYFEKHNDLQEVTCKTICVIHDLAYEEMFTNGMDYYYKLLNPKYRLGEKTVSSKTYHLNTIKLIKWFFDTRRKHVGEQGLRMLEPTINLFSQNRNVQLVTVSDYTRKSLLYHYGIPSDSVKVLYSPERIFTNPHKKMGNLQLAELIENGRKYFLMLSANRNTKNPHKAVKAFKRFAELNPDTYFVAVGYQERAFPNMLNPAYLSDSDLALAIQHCYALVYPTFFEGFGYPAIEAMHYGKPVLASNVTSIPEVFEEAPLYFSPLYESEIFNALTKLNDAAYSVYAKRSKEQYDKVRTRQEKDLDTLLSMIITR